MVIRVCGARQKFSVFSLYRNLDLDDRKYEVLLTSMAALQSEDVHEEFLFVGDLNGHHQEWLGSSTTNCHGVAAFDFATVFGCDQLVINPTQARGGTLDLLMAVVPDLVHVTVVSTTRQSLRLLIEGGDWYVSQFGRQHCCQHILMGSSPGIL